jgi:nucleoside-diphosphate-sugar epimerase
MEFNKDIPVLVTGATGYIASHLIKILLERGHKVRGTVRSLSNKSKYEFLYRLAPEKNDNLTLIEADLTDRASWSAAVEGVEYIFHVASPIPPYVPKDEMELIGPAVEGTVNVLEAAVEKGAKKVIVTSSCLSIFVGNEQKVCTEEDWSDEANCPAYPKSKVKAEKAAWDFYEKNKDKIEITVVNPIMVLGPVFTEHKNSSEVLLAEIMKGTYPGIFPFRFGIVDVRDAAEGHYKAMFTKDTAGKRYALSAGSWSMEQVITCLKDEFGKSGYEINDKHVTAEEVKASGNAVAQRQVPMIGKDIRVNNERSVKELGMKYFEIRQTVVDMANSLIKHGVIQKK